MGTEPLKHSVSYPSGLRIMISMAVLFLVLLTNLFNASLSILPLTITIILLILCLVVFSISCFRIYKRPAFELALCDNRIIINGIEMEAKHIKVIMKMGYFRPVIGIKPHGRTIVPIRMCFKFKLDEDKGSTDLANWAEKNKVTMVNKPFMRWI
jgi:hypothetical protein